MNTITDKQAINEHLIRALYAAKAEFKDASSDLLTAQHNLSCMVSGFTQPTQEELAAARNERKAQEVRYSSAEKTYQSIWTLCNKMGLCG